MKFEWKKILVLISGGISYLFGQYLRGSWINPNSPFCIQPINSGVDAYCSSPYLELGWSLIVAGEVLAVIGVIVLFSNMHGWHVWKKFSYWFIPFVGIMLFITSLGQGGDIFSFGFSYSDVIHFFGFYIYAPITFLIVLITRIQEMRRKSTL